MNTSPPMAPRGHRFLAFLIDHTVFILFLFIVVAIASFVVGEGLNLVAASKYLNFFLIPYFLKDIFGGMSLGKRVLGIAVRDDGSPSMVPSKGRLVLRNLFLFIWPLEILVLAFSAKSQRLGDRLVDTIVVPVEEASKGARIKLAAGLLIYAVFAIGLFFGGVMNQMTSSEAYRVATDTIRADSEIRQRVGAVKGFGKVVSGKVETSGETGQSILDLKVLGTQDDLWVRAFLSKESGKTWVVDELDFK